MSAHAIITHSCRVCVRDAETLAAGSVRPALEETMEQLDQTLYCNNETLGAESYVGTLDEWRLLLIDAQFVRDWAAEAGPGGQPLRAYVEDLIARGLEPASNEDIARYPRL